MKSLPPLSVLEAFEAAARLGNFTLAARERHLTAGAISRHIQTLEHWCGEALFVRNGPRVALTEAGKGLQARLGGSLQSLHDALAGSGEDAGQLYIFTLPSIATSWLLPAIAGFQARHPRIQLSILTNYAMASLPPALPALAIRFGHFDTSGLIVHRSAPERHVAVATAAWQAAHPDPVHWPSGQMLRHTGSAWPEKVGPEKVGPDKLGPDKMGALKLPQPQGIEFNDSGLALAAARHGLGVAWVRERMVTDSGLVRFDKVSEDSDRLYWLTYRRDLASHPAIAAFRDWWLPMMETAQG